MTPERKRRYFNLFVAVSLALFGIYLVLITLTLWMKNPA
jgi:hypothetical protein